jgi:Spy/CpxP family protein refolding chaperone
MKRIAIAVLTSTVVFAAAVSAQTPPSKVPPVPQTPAAPAVPPAPPAPPAPPSWEAETAPEADFEWEATSDPGFDFQWMSGPEDVGPDVAPFEHELMFVPEDDDEPIAFAPDAPGGGDVIVRRMHRGRGPMRHRVHHLGMMAAELELSDEQRTKMRDIAEKQRRQSIRAKADLDIARLDLHGLMRADKADLAKINAQIDKMAKMRADLQKSQVASRIEMRSVLTAEQQQKMKELRTTPRKMKMRRAAPAPGSPDGDI